MDETPTAIDFLKCLEPDMALKILTCLDKSTDLLRASAVSRHWRNIVVSNGLSKKLRMTKYPELACITHIVQPSCHDNSADTLRDHWVYASLFKAINSFNVAYCIEAPVSASSTNNYPEETFKNTMISVKTRTIRQGNYWSSNGSYDPETPETLIYKVMPSFCVVIQILLHPFQGLFETDFSTHAPRFVRFRMGYPNFFLKELNYDFIKAQECADGKFIWTYTSPIFPMKNQFQLIELPEPAVCIGGYMQLELRGRVKNISDGKYYLSMAYFQAMGRELAPAFSFEFEEGSNNKYLAYDAKKFKKMYSMRCRSCRHPRYKIT